ncbi:MAG: response regulator transcription factor [Pseudomonadales bacterium]|nr:response regulator transcription factor [Pseudomonadales bacterium]MCP5330025.1 response regulator transcription factor [Pseudomonadales bacterium]MCP5343066.1 response regulator transcription factor [Pseudomonadales bacterium]
MHDTPKPLNVQIISRYALFREALAALLRETPTGFIILTPLPDCQALLETSATPDILLLDLDGLGHTETLNRLLSQHDFPILALASHESNETLDRFVASGVRGIVRKSDEPAILYRAIRSIVKGELWLERVSTARIFTQLSRQNSSGATHGSPATSATEQLTRKERQIIETLRAHPYASGKKLAELLHISDSTLRNHLSSVYAKLNLENRMQLLASLQKQEL